jgi:hypothetical protein
VFRPNSGLYSAGCAMRVVTLSGDCNHSRGAAIVWLLGISEGGGCVHGRLAARAECGALCTDAQQQGEERRRRDLFGIRVFEQLPISTYCQTGRAWP